ncbi:MAG: hypothetical protein ACREEI_03830 [Stellaceae bacterium]
MASYDDASNGSAALADRLFERLGKKISRLKRKELTKQCSIFQEGKKPFAYVYYRKNADVIDVWCRGDVRKMSSYVGIRFLPRRTKGPGWPKNFPGHFMIESES